MNPPQPESRRNWDPLVKLTHWGIVAAVIANALFTREGGNTHVWVGYGLAALLALRLLWGLIGPAEARFAAFPPSPARAWAHIREIAAGGKSAHASHNPLGALMVYAIWGVLGVVIATGIAMAGLPDTGGGAARPRPGIVAATHAPEQDDDDDAPRPLARPGEGGAWVFAARPDRRPDRQADAEDGNGERESPLGEVHEAAVTLLYLLIALHLAGVVFETRRSGRQIVLAMLPGRR